MSTDNAGGFVTSPRSESSFVPSTPASTITSVASPPQMQTTRPISAGEESLLIANLDDQLNTISSRFTRRWLGHFYLPNERHNKGGYTSLKRLSKDYHVLLQTLLHHEPRPKQFMVAQYLIRIVGDLNEQMSSLPIPEDPRGLFYILKELDDAIVANLSTGMSMTERVRLRNELERGRLVVVQIFDEYKGNYKVEDAIGRVYEKSLEEMEERFGMEGNGMAGDDEFEGRLQEDIMDELEEG